MSTPAAIAAAPCAGNEKAPRPEYKAIRQLKAIAPAAAAIVESAVEQIWTLNLTQAQLGQAAKGFGCLLRPQQGRPPGRKESQRITAALFDYDAGLRGIELYKRHIPRYDSMNRYRRRCETQRLNDALHKRQRRRAAAAARVPAADIA
jgi:hypothetical protein